MIDCHIHTQLCRHAQGAPLEYVAAAEAAGVSVMAFTDHLPLLHVEDTDYAMRWSELPGYVADVRQLRARRAAPEVLLGVEADWTPGCEPMLRKALAEYDFDVVLGSVHFIDDWAFDDPRLTDRYADWDVDSLWLRYFGDLVEAARTGLFDVMAHPDLIKKFGYRPSFDMTAIYDQTASALAAAGVAIEVNTAGLRKPCAELYPAPGLLAACRAAGVPCSVGSDAHHPEEVGAGWAAAREALLDAGYDSVVFFRGRERHERRIDG